MTGPETTRVVLTVVGCALVGCGDRGSDRAAGPETPATGLPPGYALRLDRENRDQADFVATVAGDALRIRTGPAGILYRPDHRVEAAWYTVRAWFTEVGAPVDHREGFGLFIGGDDLAGRHPRYTYFLVRGDGRYLIKQRDGGETAELSDGWQPSAAIDIPCRDGGDVTNELAIAVDGTRVRFLCNGESLAELSSDTVSARGAIGLRVNHNLDVRVNRFRIDAAPPAGR